MESLSNFKYTFRAGGQDLRARQLSEIRIICRILKVSSLHGNEGCSLDKRDLQQAKWYVYQKRTALNAIFELRSHLNDKGFAHSWLPLRVKASIERDPQMHILNRLLKTWGFCSVKVTHSEYVSLGRCPFTQRDSTKARFERFLENNPQFAEFVSTQATTTVADRKKVISLCQGKWRSSRDRRKRSYCHILYTGKGDLFKRVFSPVTWTTQVGIVIAQLRQHTSQWQNKDNDILRLSLFNLQDSV